jgi:hypothetical protein
MKDAAFIMRWRVRLELEMVLFEKGAIALGRKNKPPATSYLVRSETWHRPTRELMGPETQGWQLSQCRASCH